MSEVTIRVEGTIEVKDILQKLSIVKKEIRDKEHEMNQFKYNRKMTIERIGGFGSAEGKAYMSETFPIYKKIETDIHILNGKVEVLKEILKNFMEDIAENIFDYIY